MPNAQQVDFILEQLGVVPTDTQKPILYCQNREILVAGGERAGKSFVSANFLTTRLPYGKLFWLVAADYNRTRAEFDYICTNLDKLGIGYVASKQVDPGEIVAQGGFKITTKSAQDPRKLAMEAPDGVLVCEASQVDYETYLRLRGRIAERRGWMLLSGTFESCIPSTGLILTSRGILPINNVVAGDEVFGLSGRTKVVDSWAIGVKKIYEVKTAKGNTIETTDNHKFFSKKYTKKPTWVPLQELTQNNYIAIRYGTNLWGMKHYDYDFAYLAGLYIAEGCCTITGNSHRFQIATTQEETNTFLRKLNYIYSPLSMQWRKTDNKLAEDFIKLGINLKWKAKFKQVPQGIMEADKKSVIAFLRGLFDGDGGCGGASVNLYTSSPILARQVQILLNNIGVVSSIHGTGEIVVSTTWGNKFANLVGFSIKRKQDKALSINNPSNNSGDKGNGNELNGFPIYWDKVKEVKESRTELVYDITVADTSSFVANSCVVHNSLGWYP
jgi:hypothetical protein